MADTPARYSRRGPGLEVGIKPDIAHYGGSGPMVETDPTGLVSAGLNGTPVHVCGTSFAAPFVSRTLAELDLATEHLLAPRTLRALTLHGSQTPQPLQARGLKDLARQFTGFGKPSAALQMLETADHQITIVFESQLTAGTPALPSCASGSNGPPPWSIP
jgi:hypothetical protein